ncbi:unnamed protein product [Leptosia nina]|uniref:Cytochrome P450 n=1 Tax=Leptosia nina TaxID=320188 RepID=A0AAV1IT32_9NEOP
MMKKIPGFKFNFIVGNAFEILVSPDELFDKARKWATDFKGIYGFYMYPSACINIYNADDVKVILSTFKHHQKSIIYNLLKPWLRQGLLLSKGSKWLERRKILTPTFHFNVLQKYYPIMVDSTERLLETLDQTKEDTIDICPVISDFALSSICETAMGTKINEYADGRKYKEAIHRIRKVIYQRFVNIVLSVDFIFRLTSLKKEYTKYLSIVHDFTKNVIENRKREMKNISETEVMSNEGNNENVYFGKKRTAFLDFLILAQRKGQTDEVGIQEEVDTFMFRGHDTVSAALTYSLLLLAEHTSIQNKVVDELQRIFGDDTRKATMDDLALMHYLECCIKEGMRLYPPVPFISRRMTESVTLSNYTVPRGAMCHIHIYDLHRQESLFNNASTYDPDRFLPENSIGRHPYAYVAFSAGPRNCIGQKFAMIEMKLAISSILRRFELVPMIKTEDLKFTADIILKTSHPIQIKFIRLLIVILCSVEYFVNRNENARAIKNVPGFKDVFFFGNALAVFGMNSVGLFNLGRECAKKFNGIYRFYSLSIAAVNIYNPEDVEIITSSMKHHEKSIIYKFFETWLKDGLLISNGSKWQERRKILTSAFHFNILRKYFPILGENSQKLVKMVEKSNGEAIDIVPVLCDFTLDSISETAMGVKLDKDVTDSGDAYKNAVYETIKTLIHRFIRIYLYPDFIFNCSPQGIKQSRYLTIIHRFIAKVIKKRKENIRDKEEEDTATDDNDNFVYKRKKRAAMLDLLISAQKDGLIDDEGIEAEVNTFMFEGHDTTGAGLTYCLLTLAEHPVIQDKVLEELQSILTDSDGYASVEDLASMNYLERCIKETMRLYPPVPFISRKLTETVKLSNYQVPKGTMCHIHIYDMHRQESLFKDALKFDPDRFLPENSVGRHPYAYIPFSAGPRNCIGQKFAMMEMKSALSAILMRFKVLPVTTSADLEFTADLVLRNSKPVYLKFIKR